MKFKGLRIAKTILEKKDKVGGSHFLVSKLIKSYYSAIKKE